MQRALFTTARFVHTGTGTVRMCFALQIGRRSPSAPRGPENSSSFYYMVDLVSAEFSIADASSHSKVWGDTNACVGCPWRLGQSACKCTVFDWHPCRGVAYSGVLPAPLEFLHSRLSLFDCRRAALHHWWLFFIGVRLHHCHRLLRLLLCSAVFLSSCGRLHECRGDHGFLDNLVGGHSPSLQTPQDDRRG